MRCSYGVLMRNGDEYECDDCEVKSFRRFYRCVKREIRCCVVELENGDLWCFYRKLNKGVWEKIFGEKKGQLSLF